MQVVQCTNKREAAVQGGGFLSRELVHYVDRPTLLLVSGGSSLDILEYVNSTSLRSNISFGQIDERWTKDERFLNAAMFRGTQFFKKSSEQGLPFIAMNVLEASTFAECAIQYERYLKQWKSVFQEGVILALLGIGADGHIAGVMPNPNQPDEFTAMFYDTRSWVVGYDTKGKGEFPSRATLSLHFLLQEVTTSFVYACGKEKKGAMGKLFTADGTLAEIPARILHEMPSVYLFSDSL